jgi:hypothetical protein
MKLFLLKDSYFRYKYVANLFLVVLDKGHAYLQTNNVLKSTLLLVQINYCHLKMTFISKWLPYLLTFLKPQKP